MKFVLASIITVFAGTSAFAAKPLKPKPVSPAPTVLQCSLTLMAPVPWAPSHLWITPETGVLDFSYVAGTEKLVKVAVENIVPDSTMPQYRLVPSKTDADTILTVDFSTIDPDGNKMADGGFGFYFRLPTDGQHPAWAMGGYSKAASSEVAIAKDKTGYVVMNCRW